MYLTIVWQVGYFHLTGRKVIQYLFAKKNDKQRLNNYRPISLLPIRSKIFERLVFNEMFGFFIESDVISQYQSSFKPGDEGFGVCSVFLDISKAFDKV